MFKELIVVRMVACFIINIMKILMHANFVDTEDDCRKTLVNGGVRRSHMQK